MVKNSLAAAKVVGAPVTVVPPADTVSAVMIWVQLMLHSALSAGADGRTIVPAAKVPVGVKISHVSPAATVTVKAVARCGSWRIEQEWSGELEANSCMLVGTLAFTVPEVNGQLIIDLHLVANEQVATNRYQTVVIPRAEATTRTTAEPRS